MLWSAIGSGFITGLIPIGLAEAAAIALGAVQPPERALALLAAFTVAHSAGKIGWYWLGVRADVVTGRYPRLAGYVERARSIMAKHPVYGAGVLAAAAVASVPPFHLASIGAGIAKIPFWRFFAISVAGRAVRFGILGAVPTLLRAVFA